MTMSASGVLVVDKPAGLTSAAVVARVKRSLGARKIGHAGTLDPMATGVLVLCVGDATKIAGYLLGDDKGYDGELELGVETDTLDADGTVTARDADGAARVTRERLVDAMAALVGEIDQVPPMYSALKRDGVRLHALARAGVEVDRPPRRVRVNRFDLLDLDPPRARFAVDCSKGTYVRSLVRDVGAALGCGARLTALRRTRSGAFDLSRARPADEVTDGDLLPMAVALAHLPAVVVPPDEVRRVTDGLRIAWTRVGEGEPPPLARLVSADGALLALARVEEGALRYERVFRPQTASAGDSST